MCKNGRRIGWRCGVIALSSTNKMRAANPRIWRRLPIFPVYSSYPKIPLIRIGRKTIEVKTTAFRESVRTVHCTTTLAHTAQLCAC